MRIVQDWIVESLNCRFYTLKITVLKDRHDQYLMFLDMHFIYLRKNIYWLTNIRRNNWGKIMKIFLIVQCFWVLGIQTITDKRLWSNWWIDEWILWNSWPAKNVKPYFQPAPVSEIFTIVNLRHTPGRELTCTDTEFRFYWMKLCGIMRGLKS